MGQRHRPLLVHKKIFFLLFTVLAIVIGAYVISLVTLKLRQKVYCNSSRCVKCPLQQCSAASSYSNFFTRQEVKQMEEIPCLKKYGHLFESPIQYYIDKHNQATEHGFSGNVIRAFNGQRKFSNFELKQPSDLHQVLFTKNSCKNWGVVTTIFNPSEAVRRQVRLKGWCLVIVADEKGMKEYNTGWTEGEGNNAVVYLTPDEQKAMKIPFVDLLPWNHFGRKNVGFVYAIQHGAEVIWDFDDHNLLKFWVSGAAPSGAPSLDASIPNRQSCINNHMEVLLPKGHSWPTYNPFPKLGAPSLPSWPRGLPLDDIKVPRSFNTTLQSVSIDCSTIGVLQSLADYQPDVDAIFQFTQPYPFWFTRSKETRPLIVPTGVITPYNAQATLHFSSSFFGLLLPVTVSSRVSDIWRSYFAQHLFWDVGIKVGFAARPLVVKDRNILSYTKDMSEESDLYLKSKELISFLREWKGRGSTIVERTEELWIALYEREYIEDKDVSLLQQWLQFLLDVGYMFPLVRDEHSSVPLLSYPIPASYTSSSSHLNGEEILDEETVQSYCKSVPSLKFVTGDRHTGTRIDIPSVLGTINQAVFVINDRFVQNLYPDAFKLNGVTLYNEISPSLDAICSNEMVMLTKKPKNYNLIDENMIRSNFEFYKFDKTISTADAFFCSFPSVICEMWLPFNKTIVLGPAHRYNLWMCTENAFNHINEHLYKLDSLNKLVLGAGSKYDLEYLRHYTGLSPLPLYNFCGVYTAGHPYSPTKDEIIMFGGRGMDEEAIAREMANTTKNFKVVHVRELYPHYSLGDLVKHRAAIFVAYAVMTYKICELYALNIPLIVPSIKFYRTVFKGFGGDRVTHGGFYCPSNEEVGKPHPTSLHPYSPNVYASVDQEAESYWLQFADFYHWPHVTYFDDYQHLEEVLSEMNFKDIHRKMVTENKRRLLNLQYNLCAVTHRVQKTRDGSTFPKDYNKAIKELYGVNNIQDPPLCV